MLDSIAIQRDWDDFTPKATLEYTPTKDVLLYATYSEGFKSGGFNLCFGTPDADPFDPDSVKSYEMSAKVTWLDGRLRTNLSVFLADYTDQQIQVAFPNPNTGLTEVITRNAGESEYSGVEFEAQALGTDKLTLGTAVGYLDTELKEFDTVATGDISGFTPRDAPRWTVNAYGDYVVPLSHGDIAFHIDGAWRSENVQNPTALAINQQVIDSYFLANVRTTYTNARGNWSVALWSNNLFGEEYEITRSPISVGVSAAYLSMRRTYGETVEFKFN